MVFVGQDDEIWDLALVIPAATVANYRRPRDLVLLNTPCGMS
jgi:hypothetical protein